MTVINLARMIGVGKTTATTILSEFLHSTAYFEPVDGNPYLPLFYSDRVRADKARQTEDARLADIARRYVEGEIEDADVANEIRQALNESVNHFAFSLQIFFLTRRFAMIKQALNEDNSILDRSIYEDALFTKINHDDGGITTADYHLYLNLLDEMMGQINETAKERPDLMVFLDAPFEVILERIKKRGRPSEQLKGNPEQKAYYEKLYNAYHQWYDDYDISPKIKINVDELDLSYEDNQKKFCQIIQNKLDELDAQKA